MSARVLFEIALRVFGLWFLFKSSGSLLMSVSLYVSSFSAPIPDLTRYLFLTCGTLIVQILLGGALIYWAPNLAARFYPPGSEGGESRAIVGPGDVYRTACFVLGAYLLVQAATPAGRLAIAGMQGFSPIGPLTADAITTIVHVTSGLFLVFGSRWIAELLSNLRYDPDTIPNQRISIAMLLIVILLVAVTLGVIRRISSGAM